MSDRSADVGSIAGAAHPGRADYVLLLLLAAVWGGSFLLIKLAVATVPPLTVASGRIVVGAVFLGAIAAWRGSRLPADPAAWGKLFAMGVLGTMLPFTLIGWGETRIDSGLAAILMSAVPLGTILLAHLFQRDEPLTAGKMLGVLLGVAGIVVLIGPGALAGVGHQVLAQLAVLAATLCYAANSVLARRLVGVPAETVAIGMLLTAGLVGLPVSLAVDRPWRLDPSLLSILAVVALGVLSTAIGSLLLFRIIARAGAGFSSFNNFLVPLFGVFWGVALLGEEPQPRALAALALVLAGVAAPRLLAGRGAEAVGRSEV